MFVVVDYFPVTSLSFDITDIIKIEKKSLNRRNSVSKFN